MCFKLHGVYNLGNRLQDCAASYMVTLTRILNITIENGPWGLLRMVEYAVSLQFVENVWQQCLIFKHMCVCNGFLWLPLQDMVFFC